MNICFTHKSFPVLHCNPSTCLPQRQPLSPGNLWSVFCCYRLVWIFRLFYEWNNRMCPLFCLTSFTNHIYLRYIYVVQAAVCLLLLPSSSPLYGFTIVCLFIHGLLDIWIFWVSFWLIWIRQQPYWIFVFKSLVDKHFHFYWSVPGVELLGCISLCPWVIRTANLLSKVTA